MGQEELKVAPQKGKKHILEDLGLRSRVAASTDGDLWFSARPLMPVCQSVLVDTIHEGRAYEPTC